MEIHFKTTQIKDEELVVAPEIIAKTEVKLLTLKKHLKKNETQAQVYVELGKVTESHQSGNIWRAQINLDSNGKRFHADTSGEHLQVAIDDAIKEIEVSLRKAKQKNESMFKRGGSALKRFMRLPEEG